MLVRRSLVEVASFSPDESESQQIRLCQRRGGRKRESF
jgi:hypothetical protein